MCVLILLFWLLFDMSDPGVFSLCKPGRTTKNHQDLPLWKSAVGLCSATWARAALLCLAQTLATANVDELRSHFFHMSNDQNGPPLVGWLVFLGGHEILAQLDGDYFINHEIRIPIQTTSRSWKVIIFFSWRTWRVTLSFFDSKTPSLPSASKMNVLWYRDSWKLLAWQVFATFLGW